MRGMRILIRCATALSLATCLVTAALWVHGYLSPHEYRQRQWWADGWRYRFFEWTTSDRGFLIIWSKQNAVAPPPSERGVYNQPEESRWVPLQVTGSFSPMPDLPCWMRLGFQWTN